MRVPRNRVFKVGVFLCLGFSEISASDPSAAATVSTGIVHGVVKAADGTPISGANISYGLLAPSRPRAAAAMTPPIRQVVSAADGSFSLSNLSVGAYLACASVRTQAYLDPCHWSYAPPTFVVKPGQAASSVSITMPKSKPYPIVVNDPNQVFAAAAATSGAQFTLRAQSPSGALHSAMLASKTAAGRNYTVNIPLDMPVRLFILAGAYQLKDSNGLSVASTSAPYQITAPSSGPASSLTFTVTGVANTATGVTKQ